MFPDDDLVLDVCTINTVFSIMKAYNLLAAQPSLCDAHWWVSPLGCSAVVQEQPNAGHDAAHAELPVSTVLQRGHALVHRGPNVKRAGVNIGLRSKHQGACSVDIVGMEFWCSGSPCQFLQPSCAVGAPSISLPLHSQSRVCLAV